MLIGQERTWRVRCWTSTERGAKYSSGTTDRRNRISYKFEDLFSLTNASSQFLKEEFRYLNIHNVSSHLLLNFDLVYDGLRQTPGFKKYSRCLVFSIVTTILIIVVLILKLRNEFFSLQTLGLSWKSVRDAVCCKYI